MRPRVWLALAMTAALGACGGKQAGKPAPRAHRAGSSSCSMRPVSSRPGSAGKWTPARSPRASKRLGHPRTSAAGS